MLLYDKFKIKFYWFSCNLQIFIRSSESLKVNTVPNYRSEPPNSDISQKSETLYALTDMSLFFEEEDFAKKKYIFFRRWAKWTHFYCFWKIVLCRTGF